MNKNRLARLEQRAKVRRQYKYLCVLDRISSQDAPYQIQPYTTNAGEPFILATVEDLQAFRTREDVNLKLIVFGDLSARESATLGDVSEILSMTND